MVAFPFFFPVILYWFVFNFFTVAIFLLLLLIDFTLSPLASLVTFKVYVLFFLIAFLVAESLTVAFNFGIISDCVSPQLVHLRSFSPAAKTVAAFTVSQEL